MTQDRWNLQLNSEINSDGAAEAIIPYYNQSDDDLIPPHGRSI